ncbi:hypothetical protein QTP86_027477, partial [Hemibagrus guttatus]
MNEENEREKRVEGVNSVEQKVDKIRKDEVRKALKRMKSGRQLVLMTSQWRFNGTEIVANSEYVFVEGDTKWTPSGFLFAILNISSLLTVTTPAAQTEPPAHVVLRPTVQAQNSTTGGNSAWFLGIIIPCSIVIILIPCWILLC